MKIPKLAISSSWQTSFRNWAAELRGTRFWTEDDFTPKLWAPRIYGGGSMTVTASNFKIAEYYTRRPRTEFEISLDVTFGGAASNICFITLPAVAAQQAITGYTPLSLYLFDVTQVAGAAFIVNESSLAVRPDGSANFSTGSSIAISICGNYRSQ